MNKKCNLGHHLILQDFDIFQSEAHKYLKGFEGG